MGFPKVNILFANGPYAECARTSTCMLPMEQGASHMDCHGWFLDLGRCLRPPHYKLASLDIDPRIPDEWRTDRAAGRRAGAMKKGGPMKNGVCNSDPVFSVE